MLKDQRWNDNVTEYLRLGILTTFSDEIIFEGDLVMLAKLSPREMFMRLGSYDPFGIVSKCTGKIMMVLGEGDNYRAAAGLHEDFGFGGGEVYGKDIDMKTVRCLCEDQVYDIPLILITPYMSRRGT